MITSWNQCIRSLQCKVTRLATASTSLASSSGGDCRCTTVSKNVIQQCSLSTTALLRRERRPKVKERRDDGLVGESYFNINDYAAIENRMPTLETLEQKFNGILYTELPIAHIKVSKNNTIVTVSDWKGVVKFHSSAGVEGFKTNKKGTNVAGQAAAFSVGIKCKRKNMDTMRVHISGVGAGRVASLKGLVMAGMNIVSISDVTRLAEIGPRQRGIRKV